MYIKAISYYLPDTILTNEEIVRDVPNWNAEKISSKIGVDVRHISSENETSGDMGEKAALKLISEWGIDIKSIDFVLLCTQSPDYFLPTTACILQHKLGIPSTAGALDFNLGCSGFVYGLALAKGLVISSVAKNVLLITSETYSKFIKDDDIGNRSIFGDAAAATLISHDGFLKIGDFSLGTDGSGANNLIVKNGGLRSKFEFRSEFESNNYLYMNGAEIFTFTQDAVPNLVQDTLEKNATKFCNVNLFIFHQANKYMLDFLKRKNKIDDDKFYYYLSSVGNTVSSTIPIALYEALIEKRIKSGFTILIAGFGVGYSWGGTILFHN